MTSLNGQKASLLAVCVAVSLVPYTTSSEAMATPSTVQEAVMKAKKWRFVEANVRVRGCCAIYYLEYLQLRI